MQQQTRVWAVYIVEHEANNFEPAVCAPLVLSAFLGATFVILSLHENVRLRVVAWSTCEKPSYSLAGRVNDTCML